MLLGFNMYIMFFIVSLSINARKRDTARNIAICIYRNYTHQSISCPNPGIYEFLYKPWMNAFLCVSVKSTKTYLKVSLHARDTPASERSHERFMLTKSPLTYTMTTHRRRRRRRDGDGRRRNEKSSSSEINLRNEFNTSKLEQPISLENGRTIIHSFWTKFSSYNKIFILFKFQTLLL